jgi:hypothetical protein
MVEDPVVSLRLVAGVDGAESDKIFEVRNWNTKIKSCRLFH